MKKNRRKQITDKDLKEYKKAEKAIEGAYKKVKKYLQEDSGQYVTNFEKLFI